MPKAPNRGGVLVEAWVIMLTGHHVLSARLRAMVRGVRLGVPRQKLWKMQAALQQRSWWWRQGSLCDGEHGDGHGNTYRRSMPSFTIAAVAIVAVAVMHFSVRR